MNRNAPCSRKPGLCQTSSDPITRSYLLNNLGNIERFAGDFDRAAELYRESLHLKQESGNEWAIAYTSKAARAAGANSRPKAALLFGAAAAIPERAWARRWNPASRRISGQSDRQPKLLSSLEFESAWKEGEMLPLTTGLEEAASE